MPSRRINDCIIFRTTLIVWSVLIDFARQDGYNKVLSPESKSSNFFQYETNQSINIARVAKKAAAPAAPKVAKKAGSKKIGKKAGAKKGAKKAGKGKKGAKKAAKKAAPKKWEIDL